MPKFLIHALAAAIVGGAIALLVFEQFVVRQRREIRVGTVTIPVETAKTLYEAKDLHVAMAIAAASAGLLGAGLAEFAGRRRSKRR